MDGHSHDSAGICKVRQGLRGVQNLTQPITAARASSNAVSPQGHSEALLQARFILRGLSCSSPGRVVVQAILVSKASHRLACGGAIAGKGWSGQVLGKRPSAAEKGLAGDARQAYEMPEASREMSAAPVWRGCECRLDAEEQAGRSCESR